MLIVLLVPRMCRLQEQALWVLLGPCSALLLWLSRNPAELLSPVHGPAGHVPFEPLML